MAELFEGFFGESHRARISIERISAIKMIASYAINRTFILGVFFVFLFIRNTLHEMGRRSIRRRRRPIKSSRLSALEKKKQNKTKHKREFPERCLRLPSVRFYESVRLLFGFYRRSSAIESALTSTPLTGQLGFCNEFYPKFSKVVTEFW